MAEQDDGQELAELTVRACEYCGGSIPKRRKDARFCSTSHRVMAHRKAKREREIHASLVARGLTDQSLAELHERARAPRDWRDDPRCFSDFGDVPGDAELAARIDAEDEGLFYDDPAPMVDEQSARFRAMVQDAGERTPRETWKDWRAYGRRHGTEHPEATADRIERHRAAEAAHMARIDRSATGRIQDRFDSRTAASVAQNAVNSRALNVRHVDQPPHVSPAFSFEAEQVTGDFYRQAPGAGQRSQHADFAWRMQDGW